MIIDNDQHLLSCAHEYCTPEVHGFSKRFVSITVGFCRKDMSNIMLRVVDNYFNDHKLKT